MANPAALWCALAANIAMMAAISALLSALPAGTEGQSFAVAAGVAALADEDYYRANCRRIMETRATTKSALERLGFFVTDSSSNFLLAGRGPVEGGELYRKLKARGILVRHFSDPAISDYVRITIGTPEQMDALLAAIGEILKGDAS